MLGTGLEFRRIRGEDWFYNPPKTRRENRNQPWRDQTDVSASQSRDNYKDVATHANLESEKGIGSTDSPKPVSIPSPEPIAPPLSNLERFLESVMPSVPALHLSKTTMRGWQTREVELEPYFVLGDLWESFKEWSAYGVGVPLILNDCDSVVQYYVPYLSGIQIYADPMNMSASAKSRQPGEDSDSDFRDSSSDGSSDYEPERGANVSREKRNHHMESELSLRMDRLFMRDQQILQEDFSSDEGESVNSRSCLIFEYFEQDTPYSREPFANKIADLAFRFPELKTLRSCDLLSSSWVSVAWYPIYRIPTGPTLKDLDACFLTYHYLHTPIGGGQSAQAPAMTCSNDMDGLPTMSLPVFGLAWYKFKAPLWTPYGTSDCHLANSLFQAADNWLRLLQVNQPDFTFFCRR
ncbi:hypothetical protein V6N13_036857 [Hibiscus sabdariffa]